MFQKISVMSTDDKGVHNKKEKRKLEDSDLNHKNKKEVKKTNDTVKESESSATSSIQSQSISDNLITLKLSIPKARSNCVDWIIKQNLVAICLMLLSVVTSS